MAETTTIAAGTELTLTLTAAEVAGLAVGVN